MVILIVSIKTYIMTSAQKCPIAEEQDTLSQPIKSMEKQSSPISVKQENACRRRRLLTERQNFPGSLFL